MTNTTASATGSVDPIFVSVKVAAQMLAETPWSVTKLLDARAIASQWFGPVRKVRVDSLRKYADSLPADQVSACRAGVVA